MNRLVRHRPAFLLRLLMLVVVALGTAGGTLASALGDLHGMSHADHPAVPHDGIEDDVGHDEDTGARLLHALVHCSHCHGHGGVLPFASAAWELDPPQLMQVSAIRLDAWRPAPLESLLRPPIQG